MPSKRDRLVAKSTGESGAILRKYASEKTTREAPPSPIILKGGKSYMRDGKTPYDPKKNTRAARTTVVRPARKKR